MSRRGGWIALLLAANLALAVWTAAEGVRRRHDRARERLERRLGLMIRRDSPEEFFAAFGRGLFQSWRGRPLPRPGWSRRLEARSPFFRSGLLQVVLSDGQVQVFQRRGIRRRLLPLQPFLSLDYLARYRLLPPRERVVRRREAPDLMVVQYQDVHGKAGAGRLQILHLLVDLRRLSRRALIRDLVRRARRQGDHLVFLDPAGAGGRPIGPGMTAGEALGLARSQAGRETWAAGARGSWTFLPRPGEYVLAGFTPWPAPVVPGWVLALPLVWLPLVWRWSREEGAARPGLGIFLPTSVFVAAGLPLVVTVVLGGMFLDNRRAALEAEELGGLVRRLQHLDNLFPVFLERYAGGVRDLLEETSSGRRSVPALVQQLNDLEMKSFFEHGYLTSSAGVPLRHSSYFDGALRPFLRLAPGHRWNLAQKLIGKGYLPGAAGVKAIMTIPGDGRKISRLWAMSKTELQDKLRKVMATLAKSLARGMNRQAGAKTGREPAGPEDASDLLYGGLLEGQMGDLQRTMTNNLFSFVFMGSRPKKVGFFLGPVRQMGEVAYLLMLVANTVVLEYQYLTGLFQRLDPAGEVRFFAQSPLAVFRFPNPLDGGVTPWDPGFALGLATPAARAGKGEALWGPDFLARFQKRVQAGHRTWQEITWIGGERVLLAGLACRHLPSYCLFAAKPYARLAGRWREWLGQAAGGTLLIGLVLMIIVWLLRGLTAAPLGPLQAGIAAMARRETNHRVDSRTGDEWDEVADAFNRTLGTLEELEMARIIQARLLPAGRVTGAAGVFLGRCVMNQEVGGDYTDALPLADGTLAFAMGDVTGHGVSAALGVAMAKSAFTHLCRRPGATPAGVLDGMGWMFREQMRRSKAMTCQVGFLRPDGELIFANAGHPFPYLRGPGGAPTGLGRPGLPLGVRNPRGYINLDMRLEPGSRLFLFTDGVVEARNPAGQVFGFPALEALVASLSPAPPEEVLEAFLGGVQAFAAGRGFDDDLTVAVVEVTAVSTGRAAGPALPSADGVRA